MLHCCYLSSKQKWRSGSEPVHQRGGRGFDTRLRHYPPHFLFPFRERLPVGQPSQWLCPRGNGLQPSGLQRSLGQKLAFSLFFPFQKNPFFSFCIFKTFSNGHFQMLAISSLLLQIGHMAYVIGVESCKLQVGAVHLLFWTSILLSSGILHLSPCQLHLLHNCSNAHMLYMFLGQKIMRITMVLSILYF